MAIQALGPPPLLGPIDSQGGLVTPIWQQWFDLLRSILLDSLTGRTYLPTITPYTNIDDTTAYPCWYQRRGNIVTVFGSYNADITAPGDSAVELSLPIPTTIDTFLDLSGTATTNSANESARIYGNPATNQAHIQWQGTYAVLAGWSFQFSYVIR